MNVEFPVLIIIHILVKCFWFWFWYLKHFISNHLKNIVSLVIVSNSVYIFRIKCQWAIIKLLWKYLDDNLSVSYCCWIQNITFCFAAFDSVIAIFWTPVKYILDIYSIRLWTVYFKNTFAILVLYYYFNIMYL